MGTCNESCTGTCTSACVDDCTGRCTGNCTGLCSDNCSGECTGLCSDNCSGECTGDCTGTCVGTNTGASASEPNNKITSRSEPIIQAFDRFTAHVLAILENMRKENLNIYATKEEVKNNSGKIDKILVNGDEQTIGTDKSINIDLDDYATKEFVDMNGGKIDKILINGTEQAIVNKSVDITITGSSESQENAPVYLTGVKSNNGEAYYNKSVYINPANGEINATSVNANKVYGALWNDYAEWFEKQDINEEFVPGDICSWNETGVVKANTDNDIIVIGVYSDSYGHILGGEQLDDMSKNLEKFVPIALKGRVKVFVSGKVNIGDYIIPSEIPGVGIVDNYADLKLVVGQALESKDTDEISRITIFIK